MESRLAQAIHQYYYDRPIIGDLAPGSGRSLFVDDDLPRCTACKGVVFAPEVHGGRLYHKKCPTPEQIAKHQQREQAAQRTDRAVSVAATPPAPALSSRPSAPPSRPPVVIASIYGHAVPLATWSTGPSANTGDRYWITPQAFGDLRGVSVPLRLDHLDHNLAADVKVAMSDEAVTFIGKLYDTEINRDLVYARELIGGCSIGFTALESRDVPSMDSSCDAKVIDRATLREISLVLPPRRPAFPCTSVTIIPRADYA